MSNNECKGAPPCSEPAGLLQKSAESDEALRQLKHIIGHQGSLKASDPHCKGLTYNAQVEWESREATCEPLGAAAKGDPLPRAACAKESDLTNVSRWRHLQRLAQCEKHLL